MKSNVFGRHALNGSAVPIDEEVIAEPSFSQNRDRTLEGRFDGGMKHNGIDDGRRLPRPTLEGRAEVFDLTLLPGLRNRLKFAFGKLGKSLNDGLGKYLRVMHPFAASFDDSALFTAEVRSFFAGGPATPRTPCFANPKQIFNPK